MQKLSDAGLIMFMNQVPACGGVEAKAEVNGSGRGRGGKKLPFWLSTLLSHPPPPKQKTPLSLVNFQPGGIKWIF